MVEQSSWMQKVAADPGHSQWYIERFRSLARAGEDLAGEARLVDAMAPRGARILDAGCGPGRLGGHLAAAGHHVVGVDVDPALIAAAEQDHPGPRWLVGDLAELDLPARGITEPFDVILSAGNVMTFLAASTRVLVLTRLRAHLAGTVGRSSASAAAATTSSPSSSTTRQRPASHLICCCPVGICGRSPRTPTSSSRCFGGSNRQRMGVCVTKPFEVHASGALLHGTRADLSVGDRLIPGCRSNYEEGRILEPRLHDGDPGCRGVGSRVGPG